MELEWNEIREHSSSGLGCVENSLSLLGVFVSNSFWPLPIPDEYHVFLHSRVSSKARFVNTSIMQKVREWSIMMLIMDLLRRGHHCWERENSLVCTPRSCAGG